MHEMKTRRRVSLIAVVAAAALAITACSPSTAVPKVIDTASGISSLSGSPALATSPVPSAAAPSTLNGTYRWTMTKEHALAYAPPEDTTPAAIAQLPRVGTRILKDGTWVGDPGYENGDNGTYIVQGNQITFRGSTPPPLTFTFSADAKGNLTLSPVQPMSADDAYIWATELWTKIQ
jgi:hypothetical protein